MLGLGVITSFVGPLLPYLVSACPTKNTNLKPNKKQSFKLN